MTKRFIRTLKSDRRDNGGDAPARRHTSGPKQEFAGPPVVASAHIFEQTASLSDMAKVLLHTRMKHEQHSYEVAQTYGPRQVYPSQLSEEQWNNMLMEAVSRLKLGQIEKLDEKIASGKSSALDIELGQQRRSDRMPRIDV